MSFFRAPLSDVLPLELRFEASGDQQTLILDEQGICRITVNPGSSGTIRYTNYGSKDPAAFRLAAPAFAIRLDHRQREPATFNVTYRLTGQVFFFRSIPANWDVVKLSLPRSGPIDIGFGWSQTGGGEGAQRTGLERDEISKSFAFEGEDQLYALAHLNDYLDTPPHMYPDHGSDCPICDLSSGRPRPLLPQPGLDRVDIPRPGEQSAVRTLDIVFVHGLDVKRDAKLVLLGRILSPLLWFPQVSRGARHYVEKRMERYLRTYRAHWDAVLTPQFVARLKALDKRCRVRVWTYKYDSVRISLKHVVRDLADALSQRGAADQTYLVGYSKGALVSLGAKALLGPREIAGVISVNGANRGTELVDVLSTLRVGNIPFPEALLRHFLDMPDMVGIRELSSCAECYIDDRRISDGNPLVDYFLQHTRPNPAGAMWFAALCSVPERWGSRPDDTMCKVLGRYFEQVSHYDIGRSHIPASATRLWRQGKIATDGIVPLYSQANIDLGSAAPVPVSDTRCNHMSIVSAGSNSLRKRIHGLLWRALKSGSFG